jgi:adenine/guanine phosphoribosyltransferase-like PRPP-binding protein
MTDRSGIVKKFAEAPTKTFMTLGEAEALAIELAMQMRREFVPQTPDPFIVVGIANGGLMVAKIVAETLGYPFETIRIQRSGSRLKRKIGRYGWLVRLVDTLLHMRVSTRVVGRIIDRMNRLEIDTGGKLSTESNAEHASFKDKHIILVDDCIQSGETIRLAKKMLLEAGAKEVLTGVLTLKKDKSKSEHFDPIVYLNTRIQYYPWSQNNKEYENYLSWLNGRGIKPWL